MFQPPSRRDVRQRSGFSVRGEHAGKEIVLAQAVTYQVDSSELSISWKKSAIDVVPQFGTNNGLIAFGGYCRSDHTAEFTATLTILPHQGSVPICTIKFSATTTDEHWSKFGNHCFVDSAETPIVDLVLHLTVSGCGRDLTLVNLFGIEFDAVTYYDDAQFFTLFHEKTALYLPEIYYFQPDMKNALLLAPSACSATSFGEDVWLVNKACNRCSRFLPIDAYDERSAISFSNHCVRRAPCKHANFSRLEVQNQDYINLDDVPENLRKRICRDGERLILSSTFGFQLECRSCKKYVVNGALNGLRNAAQRREDSLRRRAMEMLVSRLTGQEWIFKQFRRDNGMEFDDWVWKRFGQRCFACGEVLSSTRAMALDHTRPLVYLWPLDESATCLCPRCNSEKHDKFPFEYLRYQQAGKLDQLATIINVAPEELKDPRKRINPDVLELLLANIEWFFDEFLMREDLQKERDGKRAADLVLTALSRILDETDSGINLVKIYWERFGRMPPGLA